MTAPYRSLLRALVLLLVKRVQDENAAMRAAGLLEDMGYDDCPVCLANRRREAWA